MELSVGKSFSPIDNDKLVIDQWSLTGLYEKWANLDSTNTFHFVDGPPFVSSDNLHYGHVLISLMKSSVLYYQRMNGMKISNKLGFDTHGLPIEMAVNKILNINTPKEIVEFGIGKYNQFCKNTIHAYSGAWRPVLDGIGRMCDWTNSYRTMDTHFMESVWWVFKQLHTKGLVYRGTRVMPFSPACNTPLSNFEASQNYKEVDDQSLYVAFKMKDNVESGIDDYIVAWTTTPWTLPSNIALCVNPTEQYKYIYSKQHNKQFIVGSHYIQRIFPDFPNDKYVVTHTKLGNELKGLEYLPLFNYRETSDHVFRILCDDFVEISTGIGSGVVHLAPGFGEDDYRVCQKNNIPLVFVPIDENGVFQSNLVDTPNSLDLNGLFYKDCNKEVTKNLDTRDLVIKKENIKHSYPFCWRTDTPLIYRAMDAWFVEASSLREDMLKNNEKINWYPGHIGTGRFKNWLENAKDWCVSRNRFFGTPIPIWVNTTDPNDYIVVGSISELAELCSVPIESITDLHMEFVDTLTIERCGKTYKRISEVFDCWFESGSVPLAQVHYPFNPASIGMFDDKEALCDFICEGIDQTRGWFYTLHVLSTALFNKPAFKNVVCAGLILAKDGKKMSKRLANYTPPMEVIKTFGADALRMYMLSLGATSAESSSFKDEDIRNSTKTLQQWINSVKFLVEHVKMYEGCTGKKFVVNCDSLEWNDYDLWIMSRLKTTVSKIKYWMTNYSFPKVISEIYDFIEDFTNWYLKFNRARLKGKEDTAEHSEWLISLNTCVYVVNVFNVAIAPFTPFLSETIHKNLCDNTISMYNNVSVLLESYPVDLEGRNEMSEHRFKLFQRVCDTIRSIRTQAGLTSVKIPVKNINLYATDDVIIEDLSAMKKYFNSDEINILQLEITKQTEMTLDVSVDPRWGKVYRAGLKTVKDYLLGCNQEQLREIVCSEKITIRDIEVLRDHLIIKHVSNIVLEKNEVEGICEINEKKITVVLDKTQDESVVEKHFERMVIYHTQKIRKNSGVRPWFKIMFVYETSNSKVRTLLEKSLTQIGSDLGFPGSLEKPLENCGKWAEDCFSYLIGEKEENIYLTIYKME